METRSRTLRPLLAGGLSLVIAMSCSLKQRITPSSTGDSTHFENGACTTYVSPSGFYRLRVKPDHPDYPASGGATYSFMAGRREAWVQTRPYTLERASVTDLGFIAGYAYTVKEQVIPANRSASILENERFDIIPTEAIEYLHILLINPRGVDLAHGATRRFPPPYCSNPPTPSRPEIQYMIVDASNNAVSFISIDVHESTERVVRRSYRLSTGQLLSTGLEEGGMTGAWRSRGESTPKE